ncbi:MULTISPECIES: LysR family transcriptional regulator [Nocardiaceae]|uniref:LysR family transcriptional regulator n=1 Tax=Nocardiaceae TaxID=85025 RepID=UPI00050BE151|nr:MULTISPECIES: LysR family transcriptional regulator [Rhodococcus]
MLTWDRMRVFAAVAEHGSVTKAGHALHMSGSGVTQHIRKLEREAGTALVEPDGRTIRLTPAGRVLAVRALEMVQVADAAASDVARIDTEIAGLVRIGAVASALRRLVVPALAEIVLTNPMLTPQVVDGEGVHLLAQLERRALDIVVFESWDIRPTALPKGVHVQTLHTEEVHLALPSASGSAARVDLSGLGDAVWTVCPQGSDAYAATTQALRDCGVEPRIAYEVSDYATQLALVEANLAVALFPVTARVPTAAVTYAPTTPVITRSLRIATSTDLPAVTALIAALTRSLETN